MQGGAEAKINTEGCRLGGTSRIQMKSVVSPVGGGEKAYSRYVSKVEVTGLNSRFNVWGIDTSDSEGAGPYIQLERFNEPSQIKKPGSSSEKGEGMI